MTTRKLLCTALMLSLSASLLPACSGGGGESGFVRPTRPPPVPTPTAAPTPSPPPTEACPVPITADCVVDVPAAGRQSMTIGRRSDYALIKRGEGTLALSDLTDSVDYRFDGGTAVEEGSLDVELSLHSNVVVQSSGSLSVGWVGAVYGHVENYGVIDLTGFIAGDVINHGVLKPASDIYSDGMFGPYALIDGSFRQTSSGTLVANIGVTSGGYLNGGFATVTGRADIDGTLQIEHYNDAKGPYLLPTAPFSVHVLHADGGVFGQFKQWTAGEFDANSPTLLITGAVRYLTDDVYFDVTTASAEQVMAAAGAGDALTVHAAGTFDAALANAGQWATPGARLSGAQRSFLSSVGTVQRLQDYAQAIRTFDSLSAHGYADASDAVLQQAAMPGSELLARIDSLHPGSAPQSWATQSMSLAAGAGTFTGQRGGYDRWFNDRLLFGYSFGISHGDLRFDRSGGTVRDQSPQWDVYLRGNGNANTYVFGDVGYSHHQLNLSRQIDLGGARHRAGAQRNLDVMRAYLEAGRDFRMGQGRLTPFASVSYAVLHGAGFVEQGDTGFELMAQPSVHERLNATAGLRLGSTWSNAGGRWTTWNVTAGYRQLLQARDDARVAFTGAPDAAFRLDGMPLNRHAGWLQMNLATGTERWNWRLGYDREGSDQAVSLGAKFNY